ncbi:putative wd40 repeat-like protein [Erysiphe necator]|uniref:Putative wd40 repeat-like protein n=1 Tax=Uncinula necator TaxID=52586 RepID=A0A0B1P6N5_UNCNE|nr:putative wd40 repeat-like protein [Erysiphe necator]
MRDFLSQPRVTRLSKKLLVGYEIPQYTHSVKVYPIPSPNGSSIILIGNENGVKIIWRGGRKFLQKCPITTNSHEVNGSGTMIVSLDSDDEVEVTPIAVCDNKPEFMENEDEFDPLNPYPGVVQTLDLTLGTGTLQLAVLSSSMLKSYDILIGNRIVFIGACADNSLRLITLPITPPPPSIKQRLKLQTPYGSASTGSGMWEEKIIYLNGHEKVSNGVSITIDINDGNPYYIIASFSYEFNGRLLLWYSSLESPILQSEPFHSICLASPARAISFNTSPSRPNYLLVAEAKGVCRIFEYSLPQSQASVLDSPSLKHGHWLLSIMTDFSTTKSKFSNAEVSQPGFGRKAIADAKWILDGSAILVLLEEGEWGIWDLEGLRMGMNMSNTQGLLHYNGIKGGSKSKFSISGFIDASKKTSGSRPPPITGSKFVPMTPGTRRVIDPFGSHALMPKKGQISVIEIPPPSSTYRTDEAILFRLGGTFAIIPSILKYWSAHSGNDQSGSIFGSGSFGQTIKLEEAGLQGEYCTATELIPIFMPKAEAVVPEIIVLGEHRFVVISSETGKASLKGEIAIAHNAASNLKGSGSDQLNATNLGTIEMAVEKMKKKNSN